APTHSPTAARHPTTPPLPSASARRQPKPPRAAEAPPEPPAATASRPAISFTRTLPTPSDVYCPGVVTHRLVVEAVAEVVPPALRRMVSATSVRRPRPPASSSFHDRR